uniref:Uncharacterized protein n=1 Tax=Setaria italica TaxID=4555 RepID=K4A4G2_SETIT
MIRGASRTEICDQSHQGIENPYMHRRVTLHIDFVDQMLHCYLICF